jgi:hypothetical protein
VRISQQSFRLSMGRDRCARSPIEQRLLLIGGQPRGMIQCRVVSRRHRTAGNGLRDTLERRGFLFRSVALPIGKVEHVARGVCCQIGGRDSCIPGCGPTSGVAAITRPDQDRVHLRIGADFTRCSAGGCSRGGFGDARRGLFRSRAGDGQHRKHRGEQKTSYRGHLNSHHQIVNFMEWKIDLP